MTSQIKLLDTVALLADLPDSRLVRGEVGTVVEIHQDNHFEVEFADRHGQTYALLAIDGAKLLVLVNRPLETT